MRQRLSLMDRSAARFRLVIPAGLAGVAVSWSDQIPISLRLTETIRWVERGRFLEAWATREIAA